MNRSEWFRLEGADPDCVYLSTASWTRPWSGIRHDLVIDRRRWIVDCTCEDAVCRRKRLHILKDDYLGCKHQLAVLELLEAMIP